MTNQIPAIAVVQATTGTIPPNRATLPIVLVNADGTQAGTVKKAAAQADTTAADLAALKVDFNLLLGKLRSAGVIATS